MTKSLRFDVSSVEIGKHVSVFHILFSGSKTINIMVSRFLQCVTVNPRRYNPERYSVYENMKPMIRPTMNPMPSGSMPIRSTPY
jgi:hypothetical protein